SQQKKDFVSIQVREGNAIYVDGNYMNPDDLLTYLNQIRDANPEVKVSISADMLALHGDVINVLDKVRLAQIQKVGYQIRAAGGAPGQPGAPPPPQPPH